MKKIFAFILLFVLPANADGLSCPSGYITVEEQYVTVADTCPDGTIMTGSADVCSDGTAVCWLVEQLRELCGGGISNLKTSGGLSFPLYAARVTTPSLCVLYNETTCYVDLETGFATDAININYNGVTYHTIK